MVAYEPLSRRDPLPRLCCQGGAASATLAQNPESGKGKGLWVLLAKANRIIVIYCLRVLEEGVSACIRRKQLQALRDVYNVKQTHYTTISTII